MATASANLSALFKQRESPCARMLGPSTSSSKMHARKRARPSGVPSRKWGQRPVDTGRGKSRRVAPLERVVRIARVLLGLISLLLLDPGVDVAVVTIQHEQLRFGEDLGQQKHAHGDAPC